MRHSHKSEELEHRCRRIAKTMDRDTQPPPSDDHRRSAKDAACHATRQASPVSCISPSAGVQPPCNPSSMKCWHVACGNAPSGTGFSEPIMMKQSLRLGTIWGIPISINSSWLLVFVLLTLSLAGHFGSLHPQWASAYHYALAVVTSLLFFSSVLLHELGHSTVAQRKNVPIRSITLVVCWWRGPSSARNPTGHSPNCISPSLVRG